MEATRFFDSLPICLAVQKQLTAMHMLCHTNKAHSILYSAVQIHQSSPRHTLHHTPCLCDMAATGRPCHGYADLLPVLQSVQSPLVMSVSITIWPTYISMIEKTKHVVLKRGDGVPNQSSHESSAQKTQSWDGSVTVWRSPTSDH